MSLFQDIIVGARQENIPDKSNMFGQFIGEWDFQWVDGKGTDHERHVPGEWIFAWILEGNAIQDVFICPSREERKRNNQPDAEYGTTVRFFDNDTNSWQICYGYSGKAYFLEAKQRGNDIVVTNKDLSNGLNEWMFTEITDTTFHWINRTSKDDGKTWHINGELFATRRN